jgi:hypothetical protein
MSEHHDKMRARLQSVPEFKAYEGALSVLATTWFVWSGVTMWLGYVAGTLLAGDTVGGLAWVILAVNVAAFVLVLHTFFKSAIELAAVERGEPDAVKRVQDR